jgi:hypothetical protein
MAKRRVANGDGLLDELKACRPRGKPSFFDKLPPASKKKALQVKELWQAGELTESRRTITSYFRKLGAAVSADTVGKWLDG